MSENILLLLEKIKSLPAGLRSDWQGTNHFELTAESKGYWWLDFSRLFDPNISFCDTEEGQRVGLVMDIAALAKDCQDELTRLIGSGT